MTRSSLVAGVYVCAGAVLVFFCIQETRFTRLDHNFSQGVFLRMLVTMLVVTMALAVSLYMAYWQLVRRAAVGRSMLKFLFFPALLLYVTSVLAGSNQSSWALTAVLFILFADPLLLCERAALDLAQSIRKNGDDQFFLGGTPTESTQLYALDFFVFSTVILLIVPRFVR